MRRIQWVLALGVSLAVGCAGPSLESRREAARPAVSALRQGQFADAERLGQERVAADSGNAQARLVRAIARYERVAHQIAVDGRTLVIGGLESGEVNQKYLRTTFGDAEAELASIDEDLAAAAEDPGISLELCVACWEIDWNGNGRVDSRDRRLMEIEQDEHGEAIPEGDPRRRPTFRFDHGDIAWARAFVSFQRAALDLVLAYDWSDAVAAASEHGDHPGRVVLRLVAPERVAAARERILFGLDQSDASRREYLAETDDDRELVPSPRQKNHPIPLPVDDALYETWEGVVGDLRRLVNGEEGLALADLLTLAEERTERPVHGYLDVGRLLAHPKDIELDIDEIERLARRRDTQGALVGFLGDGYSATMKPSPLPRRLLRMKGEIDRQDEAFERKLRYLLWLN